MRCPKCGQQMTGPVHHDPGPQGFERLEYRCPCGYVMLTPTGFGQTWTFVSYANGDYECFCWDVEPAPGLPDWHGAAEFHEGHVQLYPDDLVGALGVNHERYLWAVTITATPVATPSPLEGYPPSSGGDEDR